MKTICSLVTKAPRLAPVCLLALTIGCATLVQAQEKGQAGGYIMIIVPRGEFSQNVTNNGYGGGGQFVIRIGRSPFLMGGDIGGVTYGSVSRREPFSPTIPNIGLSVTTSNNIFLSHFVARAQPRTGPIRPYLDALIGLKFLFTRTSVSDPDDDETIASNVDLSDTAFSYGVGGGFQIPLTKGPESRILLDMGVRYLRGGRAEYLRKGSIQIDNGVAVYDVFSSRTDVLSVQVGVMFSW